MTESFATAASRVLSAVGFAAMIAWSAPAVSGELRLLMFDQAGCIYCARWEREIGPIYPKTTESEIAPLTRHDIGDALPDGVVLDRPATLTPTFVLLDDGRETGRLEGYPGEDFFWFLLGELIEDAQAEAG